MLHIGASQENYDKAIEERRKNLFDKAVAWERGIPSESYSKLPELFDEFVSVFPTKITITSRQVERQDCLGVEMDLTTRIGEHEYSSMGVLYEAGMVECKRRMALGLLIALRYEQGVFDERRVHDRGDYKWIHGDKIGIGVRDIKEE
ncbi:MAG: hypothetical protein ABIH72_01935 [archaeon]